MQSAVLGAVLAGGESRRMGRDKALLRVGGRTLVERSIEVLRGALAEVVVAARRDRRLDALDVPVVRDVLDGGGPLAGIHAALVHAGGRPVFALACDLPRVGPELVRLLVDAAGEGAERAVPRVCYPRLGAVGQPLCGVWSPACREAIERHLGAGRRGVFELLDRLRTEVVEIGPELPLYRPDLLHNLNRPGDVERLAAEPRPAAG